MKTTGSSNGSAVRRTAVRKSQTVAAEFDFDTFLGDFKRPRFTGTLIQRADLAPTLLERQKVLDELDEEIDRLERAEGDDGRERDITAVNPLATLTERRHRLTLEYNELAETYNDSAVTFVFRSPDQQDDQERIKQLMDDDGFVQPEKPDTTGMTDDEKAATEKEHETAFEAWFTALGIRSMSVTCVEWPGTKAGAPPMNVKQWEALREHVGAIAFGNLAATWFEAVQGAMPATPFSLRPSPTPEPATS